VRLAGRLQRPAIERHPPSAANGEVACRDERRAHSAPARLFATCRNMKELRVMRVLSPFRFGMRRRQYAASFLQRRRCAFLRPLLAALHDAYASMSGFSIANQRHQENTPFVRCASR